MISKEKIMELVNEELVEANKVHPLFNSENEAYAVIKEEVEETEESLEKVKAGLSKYWINVRNDFFSPSAVEHMEKWAIEVVREAIQVAAMCRKTLDSVEAKNTDPDIMNCVKRIKSFCKSVPANECGTAGCKLNDWCHECKDDSPDDWEV